MSVSKFAVRDPTAKTNAKLLSDLLVTSRKMNEDPPPTFICKDRVMIQSAVITPDISSKSLPDIFTSLSSSEQSSIHKQKIDVVYLPAASVHTSSAANGEKSKAEGQQPKSHKPAKKKRDKKTRADQLLSVCPEKCLEFHGVHGGDCASSAMTNRLFKDPLCNPWSARWW